VAAIKGEVGEVFLADIGGNKLGFMIPGGFPLRGRTLGRERTSRSFLELDVGEEGFAGTGNIKRARWRGGLPRLVYLEGTETIWK